MTTIPKTPAGGVVRREFLTLIGAASAGVAVGGTAFAQTPPTPGASPPDQKSTVVLERLPNGVLLIGIDRAEAQNRIDVPTFNALGQAYYEFEHDDALRVAVLHGRGPDFSQGLDLQSWGTALAAGPLQQPPHFLDPLSTAGPARTKPLVVVVQGHVTRIAHELFLTADVRVAAQDAIFNQGEVTAASFPGGGATIRFMREAGWANAMRYMLTGDSWNADEAYRLGLVQELTPPGQQLNRATEIAKKIAAAAPLGVRAVLASSHHALGEGDTVAFALLQPEFGRLFRSEDRREYIRALQEHRTPVYHGR
ncbi:MAG TPA: crotonase/enoyl-CoA hydratase family protein [Thermomicrobiaceae bacterium]|nr:crotonase/enoyl-CoA hydratase family protein [Thermomicrobiaceae bacterium]